MRFRSRRRFPPDVDTENGVVHRNDIPRGNREHLDGILIAESLLLNRVVAESGNGRLLALIRHSVEDQPRLFGIRRGHGNERRGEPSQVSQK